MYFLIEIRHILKQCHGIYVRVNKIQLYDWKWYSKRLFTKYGCPKEWFLRFWVSTWCPVALLAQTMPVAAQNWTDWVFSSLGDMRRDIFTSEFLKKDLSGKYILVFTCPNRHADFLSTIYFLCRKMAKLPRNMLTMQQNLKENGFTIIKFMRNNTWHSGIYYDLFRASQKLCRAI